MRLLLIEDDKELCDAIAVSVNKAGYELDICNDGSDALYYISNNNYEVILLDRMLPGTDGLTVLEKMRRQGIAVPVIMVTAMNGINDRIDGLDTGADDYLVKPFAVEELLARIRALLRRPGRIEKSDLLEFGDISYDVCSNTLTREDKSITLSKREGALLEFFLRNKERILSRRQILSRVWGLDNFVEDGNIDNYIFLLRRRLKAINTELVICTVHGVGYRLEYKNNAK